MNPLNTQAARYRDCIYCGNDAKSGEHLFPASLGGRRTFNGLLCGDCNESFSSIINALATQLAVMNGVIGVRSDHRKIREGPRPAAGDSLLGKITVDAKGKPSLIGPQLKEAAHLPDGKLQCLAVFGSEKEYQKWIEEKRALGINIKAHRAGEVDAFVPYAEFSWKFGGDETFRAIAQIALNFLAFRWPKLARTGELQDFKCYVKGELLLKPGEPCIVWFAPADAPSMPPAKTQFGHQVLIVTDPAGSHARVRFFSIYDLCVDFGCLPTDKAEAVLFDIDPLEDSPQNSLILTPLSEHPARVSSPNTNDVSGHIELLRSRLRDFLKQIKDRQWTLNTNGLLDAVNSTRAQTMADRTLAIIELLKPHQGYVLLLVREEVKRLRMFNQDEAIQSVADLVEAWGASDPNEDDGLSARARGMMETGLSFLASAIAHKLEEGSLTNQQLRLFLSGPEGAHVIWTNIWAPAINSGLKFAQRQLFRRSEHEENFPELTVEHTDQNG